MGKIRIKTLGEEEKEKKEKQKAKARTEGKKAQKSAEEASRTNAENTSDIPQTTQAASPVADEVKKSAGKQKFAAAKKKQKHSSKYLAALSTINMNKTYSLEQALDLLPKLQRAKFDETVELHINTVEKGISGNLVLPHGTGKQIRIAIADFSDDSKQVEELIKKIEEGIIDFDVLIATPDSMSKLAKVARILGPRGLMPNPKSGTVSSQPQEVAKKYQSGHINFKTEAKFPLLHLTVGKVSFGEKKLADNITSAINAVQMKNIRDITLKSTMSPGIKLDAANL